MVFASLTHEDKVAFFDLLDEYFETRPHLRGGGNGGGSTHTPNAQDRAQKALSGFAASNPKMASNMISSGLKSGAAANPKSPWSKALGNEKIAGALGTMGAAGLARSGGSSAPPPPGRSGSQDAPTAPASRGSGASGLVSSKTFGHVDTSSKLSTLTSMWKDPKNVQAAQTQPTYAPPAFESRKSNLPPPPRRNVPAASPAAEEPEEEEDEEDLPKAEALYDFASQDANDLSVKARDVVVIVEKTSSDWWTCEDYPRRSKRGLVPVTYLQEL